MRILEDWQNTNNSWIFIFQELLLDHLFQRLETRLNMWLNRVPLDMDYLESVCSQELVFLNAISSQVQTPQEVLDVPIAWNGLHPKWNHNTHNSRFKVLYCQTNNGCTWAGELGSLIHEEYTTILINLGLPVTCIGRLLGGSRRPVHRHDRMISVREQYSSLTDEQLDSLVSATSTSNPNAGYGMMMGLLRAQGHRGFGFGPQCTV